MLSGSRFTLSALVGIVLGAVFVSLLTVLVYALIAPDVFRDGLFWIILLITVPFGGYWGGLAGVSFALWQTGNRMAGAWLLAGGGGVGALLLATLAVVVVWLSGGDLATFFWFLVNPVVSVPLAIALASLWYGYRLQQRA